MPAFLKLVETLLIFAQDLGVLMGQLNRALQTVLFYLD